MQITAPINSFSQSVKEHPPTSKNTGIITVTSVPTEICRISLNKLRAGDLLMINFLGRYVKAGVAGQSNMFIQTITITDPWSLESTPAKVMPSVPAGAVWVDCTGMIIPILAAPDTRGDLGLFGVSQGSDSTVAINEGVLSVWQLYQ